jgi:hypothetical protein
MPFHVPEHCRITSGSLASYAGDGNNGAFRLLGPYGRELLIVASDGGGWEHVSVSIRRSAPSWDEMCAVKAAFWDDEDVVVQYHPRRSEYVNNHARCLHLWRPTAVQLPTPPALFVGIPGLTPERVARMTPDEIVAVREAMQVEHNHTHPKEST